MTRAVHIPGSLRRFTSCEDGGSLVEFGVVLSVFMLLFLGLIDFGRLGFSYVMAGKATEMAVRSAVVRPSACGALPEVNLRSATSQGNRYGARCSAGLDLCVDPGQVTCTGSAQDSTAADIWAQIEDLMPHNATIENLRFSYDFDPNLGYLGGPYTPIVTVEITNLDFQYISPLGAFVVLAGATSPDGLAADFGFPGMSASLPAENLN